MVMTILNMPHEHPYSKSLKISSEMPTRLIKCMSPKEKVAKERFKDCLLLKDPTQHKVTVHAYLVKIIIFHKKQIKL
uniref:Uncharacterized protein n=1 Tax=Setaria italica TaxID=4555 RepID=K4AHJ1_SETIT